MKLDTKLKTKVTESNLLFTASAKNSNGGYCLRVYDDYNRAVEWAQRYTGKYDSLVLGNNTVCACHDTEDSDTCLWRIEPLQIYS